MNFINTFSKNKQISNFMKICPVGAEMFHADRHTDGQTQRRDEANSRFSKFSEHVYKERDQTQHRFISIHSALHCSTLHCSALHTGCICSSGTFCVSLRGNMVERLWTIECRIPWNWPRKIRIDPYSVWDSKRLSSKQWSKKLWRHVTLHSFVVRTYQEEQEWSSTVPVVNITPLGNRQMRLCVSAHRWQQSCWNDNTRRMQRDMWSTEISWAGETVGNQIVCHEAWNGN